MRISSVKLAWFRGAADLATLDLDGKSAVVYGANGAGKSSFVDALEFALRDGRIEHLVNEYSRAPHTTAVINVKKPDAKSCAVGIALSDGTEYKVVIQPDAKPKRSGTASAEISTWDYRRTVRRQDEMATFINSTKLEKYSALLPLLGLDPLETAAENLRRLIKKVGTESGYQNVEVALEATITSRRMWFGNLADEQILAKVRELAVQYCKEADGEGSELCDQLIAGLQAHLDRASDEERRHNAVKTIGDLALGRQISVIRAVIDKIASKSQALVEEKLAVLAAAGNYLKQAPDGETACPACGRVIPTSDFKAHVDTEQAQLEDYIQLGREKSTAISFLCDSLTTLKDQLQKTEIKAWLDQVKCTPLLDSIAWAENLNVHSLRHQCQEFDLKVVEQYGLGIVQAASAEAMSAPPAATAVVDATNLAKVAKAVFESTVKFARVETAKALVALLTNLEGEVRKEIRARSTAAITEITDDILDMWKVLHPDDAIKNVCLHCPEDADKAIEVHLEFYGSDQESPTLTLSEGYRNSLGLCIFLAMAKKVADSDRPIILDDVVVSMDREHRGMVANLLKKYFSGRQVVILTHDRDWYSELKHTLSQASYKFKMLKSWENPEIGIQWSTYKSSFDEARALLATHVQSAGTAVRRHLDTELPLVAETLGLKLKFRRGEHNDLRGAHEFMTRLAADSKKQLQVRNAQNGYEAHSTARADFQEAADVLVPWGNRATHTNNVVVAEVKQLIDTCEKAYAHLQCSHCNTYVWALDGGDKKRCDCGQLAWKKD